MKIVAGSLSVLLLCVGLLGQSPPKKPASPSPNAPTLIVSEASYPFPLEERDKIRDQQHEYDQIEIENQKMLLKIEQNKARQAAVMDAIRLQAYQFAQTKKVNLDLYELDPAQISFVKKKVQKP